VAGRVETRHAPQPAADGVEDEDRPLARDPRVEGEPFSVGRPRRHVEGIGADLGGGTDDRGKAPENERERETHAGRIAARPGAPAGAVTGRRPQGTDGAFAPARMFPCGSH
jgi:hypothetical protein